MCTHHDDDNNDDNNKPFIWNTSHQPNRISESIFNVLIKESRKADRVKSSYHAAAIVHKGRILAIGLNRKKTHPLMARYNERPGQVFLHAEVDAIVRTINRYGDEILKESSLYVLRTTKGGVVAGSKPCSGCQSHIEHFGIPEVFWS